MKSIVFSKLRHIFADLIDTIELEASISEGGKRADVGVTFTQHIDEHSAIIEANCLDGAIGDKLAVEAQYHNESKNIQETTRLYAAHEYLVLWIYPEQFNKSDVELFEG